VGKRAMAGVGGGAGDGDGEEVVEPKKRDRAEEKRTRKKRKSVTERLRLMRKRQFLQHYLRNGSFNLAALHVGVTGPAVRKWAKKDPLFAECFTSVKEAFAERLEQEADHRGAWGVKVLRYYMGRPLMDPRTNGKPLIEREYSDQLLMFRLKALKPEMYRDRLVEGREKSYVNVYRGVDVERV
jgi:hypothetical protein